MKYKKHTTYSSHTGVYETYYLMRNEQLNTGVLVVARSHASIGYESFEIKVGSYVLGERLPGAPIACTPNEFRAAVSQARNSFTKALCDSFVTEETDKQAALDAALAGGTQ